MPTLRRLSTFLLCCLLTALTRAQGGAWADDTATSGLGGRVFGFGTWLGETYAGGFPFAANGGEIACLARWDGSAWQRVDSGVDLIGGWASFATPTIRALCEYQGSLVVAGTFDLAGGQPCNHIARWDGTTFHALGLGLQLTGWDCDVRALAVYNSELYATGDFDTAGGQPVAGIARWNGSTWAPCGSGLGNLPGMAGAGWSLHVDGTDLIVGGDFATAGGIAAPCVARWNGSSFAPMGAGFNGRIRAMADYGGQLVVGGSYSASGTSPIPGLAVWTGTAWQPFGGGSGAPPASTTALQVVGSDLYAGGDFTQPGPYLARWNGTAWSSVGGVAGVFSGSIGTVVLALGVHGGDLLVGGEFTRGGDPPIGATAVTSANVIRFDGAAWQPMGTGRGLHGEARGVVRYGADWLAFGGFNGAGTVAADGIARWDGDRWQRFAACNGQIANVVAWNGGLVVNGVFTQIGDQPITNSAFFDGSTWTAFGPPILPPLAVHQGQLFAGGTTDLRRWTGSAWATRAAVSGVLDDLHSHTDGNLYFTTTTFAQYRIYRWNGTTAQQIGAADDFPHCLGSYGQDLLVGGRFGSVNGVATTRLARWNGSTWSTYGSGVNGYAVDAIAELDGQLYVGANGDPRGFLLQWNGTTWAAVPGNLDGVPLALHTDPAVGSLHVFGLFHRVAGRPAQRYAEWRTRPRWQNRHHGTAFTGPVPVLRGEGTLGTGSAFVLSVTGQPFHLGALGLGLSRIDLPLFGCTLVPLPEVLFTLVGDAAGQSAFATAWPSTPSGQDLFAQVFLLDPNGPAGWAATNALQCTAP
ncbi:MAG: hypothetical protein JNL08_01465 [Planctomycetes bacterium]|nr:hypothetical protein [Planctomycetota bacterium]